MPKIELTPHEINVILTALGELPYTQVAPIIQHIKDQITEEETT